MISPEESSSRRSNHNLREKTLLLNTVEILNEERQTILFDVLKCDICLELPKGKQVLICEKGHHFCFTCHKKIKVCGVCRGELLNSRNFVVEELVTKLGPVLGLTDNDSPIQTPAKPIPGSFQCLHGCQRKIPSFKLLSHMRLKHSSNLLEKVICSPYSNRFSMKYNIIFNPNETYIYSAFVSDLGLCTVEIFFLGLDFHGCSRLLVNKSDLPQFRYQLVAKVPTSKMVLEYGITDSVVSHYSDTRQNILQQGNCLKISSNTFLEHINEGATIDVFFSIWKKSEKIDEETSVPSITCQPERLLHMCNDRKARRNRNRNARRKKQKSKLGKWSVSDSSLPSYDIFFVF